MYLPRVAFYTPFLYGNLNASKGVVLDSLAERAVIRTVLTLLQGRIRSLRAAAATLCGICSAKQRTDTRLFICHSGFWDQSDTSGWSYDTMLVVMNLVIVTTGGGGYCGHELVTRLRVGADSNRVAQLSSRVRR
jgi:hypothetical protein